MDQEVPVLRAYLARSLPSSRPPSNPPSNQPSRLPPIALRTFPKRRSKLLPRSTHLSPVPSAIEPTPAGDSEEGTSKPSIPSRRRLIANGAYRFFLRTPLGEDTSYRRTTSRRTTRTTVY